MQKNYEKKKKYDNAKRYYLMAIKAGCRKSLYFLKKHYNILTCNEIINMRDYNIDFEIQKNNINKQDYDSNITTNK